MENKRIVVIDDEVEMSMLLKIELETEGYEVSVANSGQEGLDLVKEIMPNLILLDIMMPGMDGYEVLKCLKEDPATKDIFVAMLTAKGLGKEIQKALDLGVDDYIAKPFHALLLIKKIESFF